MEKNNRPSLEQVLGMQIITLLHDSGYTNLRLEDDGSISGERDVVSWLPETDYLKKISVRIKDDRIVIDAEITHSVVDGGKII